MNALVEKDNLAKTEATQAAAELWQSFDDSQKTCVRFGMFPADRMQDPKYSHIESRLLAVALMDCAKQDGGMVA